ncbi:MAG TPA: sulfite exporter TauE/SafE family protein [Usitatibacter sp.]|nr:sulfite exporter TauE/SafE family protein [Usitatibacter sp.]
MIADPWFYAAAVPAILLVGISKGGFGSGAGMFATPLMALVVPIPQAAAIMLPILLVMDVTGLWAYRGVFSRENLRLILVGGVIGVGLGAVAFRYVDESWLRVLLGALAVGFVLQRYRSRAMLAPAPRSRAKGLFWSVFSGITSTIAHAGGPPLSIYLLPQRLDKAVMVGTTVIFFAIINLVKLAPYTWLGLFDARNLQTSLVLAPLAPLGIWLGLVLQRRLSEQVFYRVCYGLLLVVGAKLLWDGIAGLQ